MAINKRRLRKDLIPILLRHDHSTLGIRANENMTWLKCLYSMVLPWHNEFIGIWIYLIFAIYFWVETILVGIKSKEYDFN